MPIEESHEGDQSLHPARAVNQVVKALEEIGAPGITIVEIHPVGYGYEPNYFEGESMDVSERYGYLAIVKVEVVCAGEQIKALVQALQEQCRTGERATE